MTHPAQFHPNILEAIRPYIAGTQKLVFDPFAGLGVRLGELCDELGKEFKGIDIEDWPGKDGRVAVGDATDPLSYPEESFIVVSSPTYPNGISDHFKPSDKSKRFTYRTALGQPLQENNTGRYSARAGQKSWNKYWQLSALASYQWYQRKADALINVKNFYHQKEVIDLVKHWEGLLSAHGYKINEIIKMECPGIRFGSNSNARVDSESVIIATI